jgi:drug/metabolite transporter (DMT)-like permease
VLAAGLSALYLLAVRAPWPQRSQWGPLALICLGVVLGFPLCTSVALQQVQAIHASAILGLLPLSTAVIGSVLHRQRPSAGFWICAALGSALVVAYALLRLSTSLFRRRRTKGLITLWKLRKV